MSSPSSPTSPFRTVEFTGHAVRLIDQTRLPHEVRVLEYTDAESVARAVRDLEVRGAPALGVTAAAALGVVAVRSRAASEEQLLAELEQAGALLSAARPTAVNLSWGVERMLAAARGCLGGGLEAMRQRLAEEAYAVGREDDEACRRMGAHGAEFIEDGATVLTHCNAGGLATASYGSALGVIKAAHEAGKRIHVMVDETRPVLQGARLTAWELVQAGIPATLITDNMAGQFMRRGKVDVIVVGADRIAANGDVANKIGTYSVAVLAKENGVPFFVAAPFSTVDMRLATGDEIPIEERRPEEVLYVGDTRIAPDGVNVANPAFDVTPHRYVTGIITERGVAREPYTVSLRRLAALG